MKNAIVPSAKKVVLTLFVTALIAALVGCGGATAEPAPSATLPPTPAAAVITVVVTSPPPPSPTALPSPAASPAAPQPKADDIFAGAFEGGTLTFTIGPGGKSVNGFELTLTRSASCSDGSSIKNVSTSSSFSAPIQNGAFQYEDTTGGGVKFAGKFDTATTASGSLEMGLVVAWSATCKIGPVAWSAATGGAEAPAVPTLAPTEQPAPAGGVLPPPPEPYQCAAPQVSDFSSAGAWGTGSADWARWGVTSGEYYFAMKQPDSWGWRSDGTRETDAIFEADVRQAVAGSGAYGLAFGVNSLDNGQLLYAFVVAPGGYFGLYRHAQVGDWIEIQPFEYSFILAQGQEANHLKVVRSGPLIALYANGIPLASTYYDATYTGARYAGILAWSDQTAGLDARFDNYSVCPLAEPHPLPVSPFAEKTVPWPAGQPVVLHWTWFATTAKLAQSFASLAEMTVTIDGQQFSELGEYWGEPGPYPGGSAIQWNLPLPALEPGVHRIETTIELSEQVTDGFDGNQDGTPDGYGPGQVFGGWVELQVED